jgi:hypothetical protein
MDAEKPKKAKQTLNDFDGMGSLLTSIEKKQTKQDNF